MRKLGNVRFGRCCGLGVLTALALAACGGGPVKTVGQAPANDPYQDGQDHSWSAEKRVRASALGLQTGTNFLSDLDWTAASNGWGPVERDRSNGETALGDGKTLTLNGQTFAKGLGVHANSGVTYNLGGQCSTFTAKVGLDDEVGDRGSVAFQVFADGEKLFDSGTLRGASPTQSLNVNVAGKQELKLVVTDAGDGLSYDHADWADAQVSCAPGALAAPQPASVTVDVAVPASMRAAPFDVTRRLKVPPGFAVSVYARVPGARFLTVAPNGDLLVSQPGAGKVVLVRPNDAGEGAVTTFASGLTNPHDLVFSQQGGVTYLYLAESNKITRSVYQSGDTARRAAQTLVANLPDASTPELKGTYAHALKNIALSGGKLYVSIASATNSDPADLAGTPKRAAIYLYNADGSGGRLFAQGVRNAEGLAISPAGDLWVVVNNRDNIAYPFHNDWQNDGTGDDYGKVIQSYVDNHPPEEFIKVRDGGNYGWPYCNPNPDNGPNNMPFDRDVQNNPDGTKLDCAQADRVTKGIQAHSAPLGLSFLQGSRVPAPYRAGAVAAFHGCWNCSKFVGHKIVFFPWNAQGLPGDELDLVSGWVTDAVNKVRWGRPVDAVPDLSGNLLISDDAASAIYKLSPTTSGVAAQAATGLTLFDADTDKPLAGFDPIPAGATLDLKSLPAHLSVGANTDPATVGSVRFTLDGGDVKLENIVPYAIAGDGGARPGGGYDYYPWTPPASGAHTLRVTPYSAAGATGNAGAAYTLNFNVTR